MRRITVAALIFIAAAAGAPSASARTGSCNTKSCLARTCISKQCHRRVAHKKTVAHWKKVVSPHAGWLLKVRNCESGSSGLYALRTTGNGFWFAYQHTPGSWSSAGGKVLENIGPVGSQGELHPEPLEQDYRAVITLNQQGVGAWPVCG